MLVPFQRGLYGPAGGMVQARGKQDILMAAEE